MWSVPHSPGLTESEAPKRLGLQNQNLVRFLSSFPGAKNYGDANHLKFRLHRLMGSFNGDVITGRSTEAAVAPIVTGRDTTGAEEPQKVLSLV